MLARARVCVRARADGCNSTRGPVKPVSLRVPVPIVRTRKSPRSYSAAQSQERRAAPPSARIVGGARPMKTAICLQVHTSYAWRMWHYCVSRAARRLQKSPPQIYLKLDSHEELHTIERHRFLKPTLEAAFDD